MKPKNRTISVLFFIMLAFLALSVISWDYTMNHTLEDLVNNIYCPICSAFQAVFQSFSFATALLLIGITPVILCYIEENDSLIPHLFNSSIITNRAPPASA